MYYLETSAIISVDRKLKNIVNSTKCYTSFLTVLDLLKDTTEATYQSTRNILKNISESGIRIDWYSPSRREIAAFTAIGHSSDQGVIIKNLLDIVQNCGTFTEAKETSDSKEKCLRFSDIGIFIAEMRSGYIEILKFLHAQYAGDSSENEQKSVFDMMKKEIQGFDAPEPTKETKDAFRRLAVMLFAKNVGLRIGSTDSESVAKIASSYNNTLDIFIDAFGYYIRRDFLTDKSGKDHAAIDIDHFIYLQSRVCRIVSDNSLFLAYAEVLGKRKCVSVDNLLLNVKAK